MSDLQALLEEVAARGTPVGADVLYERALRQSAALPSGSRTHRYATAVAVWAAVAALVVVVLIRSAGGTPLERPRARTEIAAAAEGTPPRLVVRDQSTGRLVPSPIGIGWVGNSWPF
jgi:hypothetical protein